MLNLVIRQLVREPYRTLLTTGAIAGALAVILLLEGFQTGLIEQLNRVALNRGADLIVMQNGVSNFVASRSLLPQLARQRIESIDGVVSANPITMIPVIYQKPNYRRAPIFFVVYDHVGGPSRLIAGQAPLQPREIVIDKSLAQLYDINVGDPFVVSDFKFTVSGIAEGASALFTAFSFIQYDDLIDFFFDSDLVGDISNLPLVGYLLVNLRHGADINKISSAIERVEPDGDVYKPQQLAKNDMALGGTLFGPVMGVLIGAAYIVALLVVAMIMFAAVHGRLRSFGVIKALGFSNRSSLQRVAMESIIMILLSIPAALFLAELGSWVIENRAPLYLVPVMTTLPILRTLLAALIIGILGAYLPYRFIAKLDPTIVFR